MRNAFKSALMTVTLVLLTLAVSAQIEKEKEDAPRPRFEQTNEETAKRIAQELALDDTTSQKFVTTYCNFQQMMRNARTNARFEEQRPDKNSSATQANVERSKAASDSLRKIKNMEIQQRILALKENLNKAYSEFLTPEQIEQVYELERRIKEEAASQQRAKYARPKAKDKQQSDTEEHRPDRHRPIPEKDRPRPDREHQD